MSYRNPNTSQNSDEFHGKDSISEAECNFVSLVVNF